MKTIIIFVICLAVASGLLLTNSEPENATITSSDLRGTQDRLSPASGESPGNTRAVKSVSTNQQGTTPLPEYSETLPKATGIDLWQVEPDDQDAYVDGIPATRVHTDPSLIEQFHVGQELGLFIPKKNLEIKTAIDSTHNQSANVNVFVGRIIDGHPKDNVIVTRGKIETHVVISSARDGTYTAIIDNQSGETVIVDQADINANQIPFDDAILVEPIDQPPPPGMG